MIVDRYIIREIAKPMLLGCALLIVIFTAYSSAVQLTKAADGVIQHTMVLKLILLRTLISLEVLLPTALYLSVIAVLGRLYRESEMAALRASGVGEIRLLRPVFTFALLVALMVAALSIYARPWAYRQSYQLEAQALAEFDINNMEARRFIEFQGGKYVLYSDNIDYTTNKLKKVFLQSDQPGKTKVIFAREAHLPPVEFGKSRAVVFYDGYAYDLDLMGKRDITLKYRTLTVELGEDELEIGYKRKSEPTSRLAESVDPKDIAEYQWRLSTPLATLLLATLAVPLSRGAPRKGNHRNFFIAILVYVGFFNLMTMARGWVEDSHVPPLPGLWWVYGVAFLLLCLLIAWPGIRLRKRSS